MRRSAGFVISGWLAILLAPIAIPIALIAGLLDGGKGVDRTPADVFGFIEDLIQGTGGEWDWDEFECVRISDPHLDAIRERAITMGPPNADLQGLRNILAEMRDQFPDIHVEAKAD